MRVLLLGLATLSLTFGAVGQVLEYTQSSNNAGEIPLGFPVPIPVDSITPVDGFRTYSSLDLRHQQLAAQFGDAIRVQIGSTFNQLPIWAYQLSDADSIREAGGTEGSVLINGGIHAREWQSPEALTGFMEKLLESDNLNHVEQYILDNVNLVLIPVLNIDGFQQTQRYPTLVTESEESPREGRMRRKNLNGADQDINTDADNLMGIDLNRNNNPYWATSGRSSDISTSIVYHGTGAASEPETQALQQAAAVAGTNELRLYIDVHSFSQVYFTPMTGLETRDTQAQRAANIMRSANDFKYRYSASGAGAGIGSTDEFFANTYQVPAYTLEIEPAQSASEYGGIGVSHDGFVLPASEVQRMRAETAAATFAGLYTVADVPVLMKLEIRDKASDEIQYQVEWDASGVDRDLELQVSNTLQAGNEYQLRLVFNKPMRQLQDNEVTGFGNLSEAIGMDIAWTGQMAGNDIEWTIDSAQGAWLTDSQGGYSKYQTDTFAVDFEFPEALDWSAVTLLALQIDTVDMTGFKLDADPATIAEWRNGAWRDFENINGDESATGGESVAMRLVDDGSALFPEPEPPAPPPPPPPTNPEPTPPTDNSSGGGSVFWLIILAGLGWLRGSRLIGSRLKGNDGQKR